MSKNFDDNLSLISKPKARETGKVLCSQKLPTSTKTQPDGSSTAPEKGMQVEETIKLASGEKRSVTIEATNDKEWQDFVVLVEGSSALSLDQKDMMHRTIGAIAALRVDHQEDWKSYCESRGMKWRKEAKS